MDLYKSGLLEMLKAQGDEQEELFRKAREARAESSGDSVFIRGVVEISNICEGSCDYCGMREDNRELERYLMTAGEIMESAEQIKENGLNILFLQAGENEQTTDVALEVITKAKKMDMDVVLCLGNKKRSEYERLREAGADAYILKHECSDPRLHQQLRHKRLVSRLRCMELLLDLGYRVGSGCIVGLPGQSIESIADDIILDMQSGVHYVSASPFIPHEQSPLRDCPPGDGELTLNSMAAMRLALNIPIPTVSALDLVKENGQALGFQAGANVITANFTPERYRRLYSLYSGRRPNKSLGEIKDMIRDAGLAVAERGYV